MASASTAYRYDYAAPRRATHTSPSIHVVPGRGRHTETAGTSLASIARIALCILLALVVVGFVRVGLTSATITASFDGSTLRNEINASNELGKDLEVQVTALSNSTRLKSYAKHNLKMSAPGYVETVILPADVVAVDEAGNLSLAKSLSVATSK